MAKAAPWTKTDAQVLCVVWALIVITGGNLTMLNDTVMSGSLYYKVFNVFNPFV